VDLAQELDSEEEEERSGDGEVLHDVSASRKMNRI
jgi:hypothetical protein